MNNNEHEELPKLFEEKHSSGNDTPEHAAAIHKTYSGQPQRSSSQQRFSPSAHTLQQSNAHLPEHPINHKPSSPKPGMYTPSKRKAAKKRRHRWQIIIGVITAVVTVFTILLIAELGIGGGDVLKGTWDFDGVTVYQFDGNGNGSLNLPGNTYFFTYVIKENEVSIDFESNAARDITYNFTVEMDKLILVAEEENQEKTYELTKQKN